MTTLLEAPQENSLELSALRSGDRLQLRFNVRYALHVHLELICPLSGWAWSEDLGLVLPGDEVAQVELPGWSREATLLHVKVLGGPWHGRREWTGWVSGAGSAKGAYLCS